MYNLKNIFVVALLLGAFNFASCQNSNEGSNDSKIINKTLNVDDFEKKLSEVGTTQLIDVRTPEEFAGGHLKNALNIDYNSQEFADRISKLDKSKPVLVYCLSGGRSAAAARQMRDMGFTEVYNMQGGFMNWNRSGKSSIQGAEKHSGSKFTVEDLQKIATQKKFVLVDYNAKWCAPCKQMTPILDRIAEKMKDSLNVIKIDIDDNKELVNQKNIAAIPYFELYKNGNLVWQHEGAMSQEELEKAITQ
jgi:thioredoxin 1